MIVTPTGQILGAIVRDVDLSASLSEETRDRIIRALGDHGVVEFPCQDLTARQLRDFSANFGELEVNVANAHQDAEGASRGHDHHP